MGRTKEFDEGQVLEKVMEDFWKAGYGALSLRDIEESTGILKGSLYAAFGDKRSLFLAALQRYVELGAEEEEQLLTSGPTPRAGLERYLRQRAARCSGTERSRGCLLANTAAELAPHDPEVRALTGKAYTGLVARLERTLRGAQALGEVDPGRDPKALAASLVVLVQGMSVVGKTEKDGSLVRAALQLGLQSLSRGTGEVA